MVLAAKTRSATLRSEGKKMAKTPAITIEEIEMDGEDTLWDVMHATLRAKEAQPNASLLPGIVILKSHEVVARIYQSPEESRALLVRTHAGMHQIALNWSDALSMLYRSSLLMLQKVEGTAVILLVERTAKEAGHSTLCAMKWTARQFMQAVPRHAKFPETNDSIAQPFYVENEQIRWAPDVTTALQFT
jgi:hypothetical protein